MRVVIPRVIHTFDRHLGRALHEEWLIGDLAWALDCIVEVAKDARSDVSAVKTSTTPQFRRRKPSRCPPVSSRASPSSRCRRSSSPATHVTFGARLLSTRVIHLHGALDDAHPPLEDP